MMNTRAFFSVFVGVFAIALLISTLYVQSVRYETEFRVEELSVLNQELSKDWFLARNAYVNFASDAILASIESQYLLAQGVPLSNVSCNAIVIQGFNYAPFVESYWDNASDFMETRYGLNCDVNLDVELYNAFETPDIVVSEVRDTLRAYGLLSCSRSSSHGAQTITHPFVIRKDVRVTSAPLECDVNVFDVLGSTVANPFEKQDVNKAFT